MFSKKDIEYIDNTKEAFVQKITLIFGQTRREIMEGYGTLQEVTTTT